MILLTIEVVLIFTFTSSDNFTQLFYNLISFVQTYDPVYQNDKGKPEIIFAYGGNHWSWLASNLTSANISASYYSFTGVIYSDYTDRPYLSQRPVLYLNNQ